jgi:type IV secretion system protein TrbI
MFSPPSHIQVEIIEGLNSDRPGTADLVVEQDIYGSLGNGCLMIPKGPRSWPHTVARYSQDPKAFLSLQLSVACPTAGAFRYSGSGCRPGRTAGFSGDVNNHFLKIHGKTFLTAILLAAFDNRSPPRPQRIRSV